MLYIVLGSDAQPALSFKISLFKLCDCHHMQKYPSRFKKIVGNQCLSMKMGSGDIVVVVVVGI